MSKHNPITEQIQPDALTRLATCAHRTGKTVNDLLTEMLDEREVAMPLEEQPVVASETAKDWTRALRRWATSHPVSTGIADDSRESIYAGRGE